MLTRGREHRIFIGGREFVLGAPAADWLLARADSADEIGEAEANPYWGDLWPSAVALAEYIVENPGEVEEKRIVELGAGLGLPSIVAAALGAAEVMATDLVTESLEVAAANASRNAAGERIRFHALDWRRDELPPDTDLILGADLIFDPAALDALGGLIARSRGLKIRFLLTEPGREIAHGFFDQPELSGLCRTTTSRRISFDGRTPVITLHDIELG